MHRVRARQNIHGRDQCRCWLLQILVCKALPPTAFTLQLCGAILHASCAKTPQPDPPAMFWPVDMWIPVTLHCCAALSSSSHPHAWHPPCDGCGSESQVNLKWTGHQKAALNKESIMFFCTRFKAAMAAQKDRVAIGSDYFNLDQVEWRSRLICWAPHCPSVWLAGCLADWLAGCIRDALEGKGPQERLGRQLEEVAKAVSGGNCRLQMPLKRALAVRETVAGRWLGALEGEGGFPPLSNASLGCNASRLVFWL